VECCSASVDRSGSDWSGWFGHCRRKTNGPAAASSQTCQADAEAEELGCPDIGADLAAVLSERDILRRGTASDRENYSHEPDISGRIALLRKWRKDGRAAAGADPGALRTVERTSKQLLRLISGGSGLKRRKTMI